MRIGKHYLAKRLIISLLATFTSVSTWAYDFDVNGLTYSVNDDPSTVTINGTVSDNPFGAIVIPSTITYEGVKYTVTIIDSEAFIDCVNLTGISIPNTITTIKHSAFDSCIGLTSLVIPNSVTSIGEEAFYNCVNLESIVLSKGLTSISKNAFSVCEGLKSVVIPSGVKTLEDNAFFGCSNLTSIAIPNSVESIGDQAFNTCTKLESINIPNSVKRIGASAFANCTNLKTINIFATSLELYGEKTFRNNAEGRKIYVMPGCEQTFKIGWKAYANAIDTFPLDFGLSNSGKNADIIESYDGKVVDVMLYDRTLYKDGDWNTICLPFDVNIENSPLAGATARTLTSAHITGDMALYLQFSEPVNTLQAGVPYIIKWDNDNNIVDPVFIDVTINKNIYIYDNKVSGDARVRFIGTNQSIPFYDNDNVLLLGSDNSLYYASSGMTIGAQRAYFRIGEDNINYARHVTSFYFDFGNSSTSIDAYKIQDEESSWYTLQGMKLDGKPMQNGIYIHNGKKTIIK